MHRHAPRIDRDRDNVTFRFTGAAIEESPRQQPRERTVDNWAGCRDAGRVGDR